MQQLDPKRTTWHITFGTYGARLHGGDRPTLERPGSRPGDPFVGEDQSRERFIKTTMLAEPVVLRLEQRAFIEEALPAICTRGGWTFRACAAQPDHVHVLLDADRHVHGEKVRRLIKRWLTQEMNRHWLLADGARWWAEQGSNRAIRDLEYLNRAYEYIERQRTRT